MEHLDLRWLKLIQYCQRHEHLVFDRLVIKNGVPDIGEIPVDSVKTTTIKKTIIFRK